MTNQKTNVKKIEEPILVEYTDELVKCPWCCGNGVNIYEVTSTGILYSEPCVCDHNGLISEKYLREVEEK